jgi:short-subunit dehydrogenase
MTRPIDAQVVVIVGASSGIGRETALQLAARGASLVLAARNAEALEEVARQVVRIGGQAEVVPTDVTDWPAVRALAHRAVDRFGRIDTWVNAAAVSLYATIEQADPDEMAQVIAVDLIGQIHGVKAALPHLRDQGSGTIINVGSALSERAVPLQAAYAAAKHGVKGFTEALRMELDRERSGIAVVLIEPSSIDTPLFEHARSKTGRMPMPIAPIYAPSVAAEAIVAAAERPSRSVVVGGAGKVLILAERIDPRLVDLYMLTGDRMVKGQLTDAPAPERDNLFAPVPGLGSTTGAFGDRSKSSSLYTRLFERRPVPVKAILAAVLAGGVLWRLSRT